MMVPKKKVGGDKLLLKNNNESKKIGVCYRYPGKSDFKYYEFDLFNYDFMYLSTICKSLSLLYNRSSLNLYRMRVHSWKGCSLRSVLMNDMEIEKPYLIELLTYFEGFYGRFIILVSLGIGCTVWYAFYPGMHDQPPLNAINFPIDYEDFYQIDYRTPRFNRVSFVETNDVRNDVDMAFNNVHPFVEINIPSIGDKNKSFRLGLMVAFFMTIGMFTDISSCSNILL